MITGSSGCATMTLTWSVTRLEAKQANVLVKATKPMVASPAAIPTMFCSAIPTWKKRSG